MPGSFWDTLDLDKLFVELKESLNDGRFGPIRGASLHVASSALMDEKGCFSFIERIFGRPTELIRTSRGFLVQLVAIYGGRWAMQCTLVELTPETPRLATPVCIHGSLSFPRTLLEVRWGAERIISTLSESGDTETIRFPLLPLVDGDGSHG